MKLSIVLFISSIFSLSSVNCWVGVIKYNAEDVEKNQITDAHCFTDSYGLKAMKNKEEKRLENTCAIAVCNEDRSIYLTGCAVIAIQPPCIISPGNLSKPFPDCCFEIVCPPKYKEDSNTL